MEAEDNDCRWGYVLQVPSLRKVTLYFTRDDGSGKRVSVVLSQSEVIRMLKDLNEDLVR